MTFVDDVKLLKDVAIKAVNSLTSKQRVVWIMCMRNGRSQSFAARQLGLTRSAIYDRLKHARKRYIKFIRSQINGSSK